ncbi:MAG: hypothetical protein AAF490_23555 [Chloroflexota bacterium]
MSYLFFLAAILAFFCLIRLYSNPSKITEIFYFVLLLLSNLIIFLTFSVLREVWRHDAYMIEEVLALQLPPWQEKSYLFWESIFDLTTPQLTDDLFGFYMILPLIVIAVLQRWRQEEGSFFYSMANLVMTLGLIVNPFQTYSPLEDAVTTNIIFGLYLLNIFAQVVWACTMNRAEQQGVTYQLGETKFLL